MDGITLVKTALEYHDKNTEINNSYLEIDADETL